MEKKTSFLESPVKINEEIDAAGFKRIWIEVKDDEAIMLKLDAKLSKKEVDEKIQKAVDDLKERAEKENLLSELQEQVKQLKIELYGTSD